MAGRSIRLVCFDLGGVLIRICRSWKEGCTAAKLEVRAPHPLLDARNGWYVPFELIELYQTGKIACEEYFDRVSKAIDGLYSPLEFRRVHDAWLLGEYEGTGEVIDRIHAMGVKTAALSNTNHAHWLRMREFPAVMKLRLRFASHELGLHKPDPAIFREFERHTGVRGREILFFDDLPENVEAARTTGWQAVFIDPLQRTDAQIETGLNDSGVFDGARLHSVD